VLLYVGESGSQEEKESLIMVWEAIRSSVLPAEDLDHDHGVVTVGAVSACWRIIYRDPWREVPSRNPSDPCITVRAMDIVMEIPDAADVA
jgi:hypothetical protein